MPYFVLISCFCWFLGVLVVFFQSSKVSKIQSLIFKISKFQSFKISKHQSFKISKLQEFKLSKFQCFVISNFQNSNVSNYRHLKISKFQGFRSSNSQIQIYEIPNLKISNSDVSKVRYTHFTTS